ncbi:MAG TPA: ribosome assembly RNA-binding protein YhbY [Candidatus Ozemobacteraceae bacterium]|nr:ribosome assembly RNA-binding protein YhbY [Candidatus Ozemobacteraceae bacterium]
MNLSPKQRKFLETLAHELEPAVRIGKGGVTPTLIQSVIDNLKTQELIKVKILDNSSAEKDDVAEILVEHADCTLVRIIGRVLILFRPKDEVKKRRIQLPGTAQEEENDEPESSGDSERVSKKKISRKPVARKPARIRRARSGR